MVTGLLRFCQRPGCYAWLVRPPSGGLNAYIYNNRFTVYIPSRISIIVIIEILWIFVLIAYGIYGPRRPSMVDDLEGGIIHIDDIVSVEFVVESQDQSRRRIRRYEVEHVSGMREALGDVFMGGSILGVGHHNHPDAITVNRHRMEIVLVDGHRYSIDYSVCRNNIGIKYEFAILNISSRIPPYGVGSIPYESRRIVPFLIKYDPWYQ